MSDDFWTDYRQNRQIKELQGEVQAAYSYAAERSRTLQSKLSQVQGTIERRLDRLAKSFDAFVELSDMRLELAMFDREAAVRHGTRRLLMGIAQGAGDPPPLDLDDVPGYWLHPAAEALSALVRGDDATAERHVAEAVSRDEDRTTLFLTLGLAVAGRHTTAVPWLTRTLPALGTTVTNVQRRLWISCADGVFGEPGRAHMLRRLTEFLDEMPADAAAHQLGAWRRAAAKLGGGKPRAGTLPRELQNEKSLSDPAQDADRLKKLRALVEESVQADDVTVTTDFADLLNTLIDEGSPQERHLVARARELRQIVEHGTGGQSTAWDAPGGDTLDLLHGDVFKRKAPGPRALAARAGGRWLTAIAGDFAENASVKPPEEMHIRVYGHGMRIGPTGSPTLTDTQTEIDTAALVNPLVERIGFAVAGTGLAVTVLAIVAGLPGPAVLAAIVAVGAAVLGVRKRLIRQQSAQTAEQDKTRLARQVEAISKALSQSQSRHKDLVATTAADRQAILTLLT